MLNHKKNSDITIANDVRTDTKINNGSETDISSNTILVLSRGGDPPAKFQHLVNQEVATVTLGNPPYVNSVVTSLRFMLIFLSDAGITASNKQHAQTKVEF